MNRRPAAVVLATVAAVAVVTACNRGQDPAVEASGEGTTSTPAASTAISAPAVPGAAAPPVSVPAGRERAFLTAVRVDGKDGGGSRVVFEFEPGLPGYEVDFTTRPVTMDGSGDEVSVAGAAVLEVTMENAAQARFEGEKVVPTYTGPRRLRPAGASGVVVEVVEAGDFEGLVRWVIGLRRDDATVSVSTLSGPSRLVLDLAPPS